MVLEFLPGETANLLIDAAVPAARVLREVGGALAVLHAIPAPAGFRQYRAGESDDGVFSATTQPPRSLLKITRLVQSAGVGTKDGMRAAGLVSFMPPCCDVWRITTEIYRGARKGLCRPWPFISGSWVHGLIRRGISARWGSPLNGLRVMAATLGGVDCFC